MLPQMNPESFKLTLEQEFKVRQMKEACEQLSKEELKIALLDLIIQSEIRMNLFKDLLKHF
jgi:Phycobilisome degradation protein nblA